MLKKYFIANKDDAIACVSLQHNSIECAKVHNIGDIGKNKSLNAQGNIIINPSMDAVPVSFSKINAEDKDRVSSLIFKKNQTSSVLGLTRTDLNYYGTFQAFDKLVNHVYN